jgi:2-keto-4-pentenoate hydratase/2-oxohepta-3-ene-1,7-dioic acid hydratase in catechol pathway
MRHAALLALALGVASGCGAPPRSGPVPDPTADWGPVAPLSDALTFARRTVGGEAKELLLVLAVHGEEIEAVALPQANDPIVLLAQPGGAELARGAAASGPRIRVKRGELGLPADLRDWHAAGGTNFPEHGAEVGIGDPFLFPKQVRPTSWASNVPYASRLDYEVELCFVALEEVTRTSPLDEVMVDGFGVVLCNDVTARWSVGWGVIGSRLGFAPMGALGFRDGKNREGFLPVGPFLVVPNDLDAWLEHVTLELWVKRGERYEKRQKDRAREMIWGVRELTENALADEEDYHRGFDETKLLEQEGRLPRGAMLLSGTPGGVAIHNLNFLFGGAKYLRVGDEVIARASGLGALQNAVVAEGEGR